MLALRLTVEGAEVKMVIEEQSQAWYRAYTPCRNGAVVYAEIWPALTEDAVWLRGSNKMRDYERAVCRQPTHLDAVCKHRQILAMLLDASRELGDSVQLT